MAVVDFESARAVADAVLYEGYLLYPYRASARKNQIRWQWGVLVPPAYAAAGHGEHATSHSELPHEWQAHIGGYVQRSSESSTGRIVAQPTQRRRAMPMVGSAST